MPIVLTIIIFILSIGVPIYSAVSKARVLKREEKAEEEFEKKMENAFTDKKD